MSSTVDAPLATVPVVDALAVDVLVPAWNEAALIGRTLDSLVAQSVPFRRIVVIPNGCTDDTAEIARSYAAAHDNIFVLELPELDHRKSEALNRGWAAYSQDADVVVTVDADTTLVPDAVELWTKEFQHGRDAKGRPLGGSLAKAIVHQDGYWGRMQKSEYGRVVDTALLRGTTSVLAGAGTAFSGVGLHQVARVESGREGPWSYATATEDYEITLQLRKLGWGAITSPHVRMYTDGMKSLVGLWGQRMKWTTGQYHELIRFGLNRYTLHDWAGLALLAVTIGIQFLWLGMIAMPLITGSLLQINWFWWTVYPAAFAAFECFLASRLAHVDRKDLWLAAAIVPNLVYRLIGIAWVLWAAAVVTYERLTGRYADRWELQSRAEA